MRGHLRNRGREDQALRLLPLRHGCDDPAGRPRESERPHPTLTSATRSVLGEPPTLRRGGTVPGSPIKIGYCLSLTGGLATNGHTARLAHEIWRDRLNARGGLNGRDVELICVDDKSDATTVAGIYERLLSEDKVDLLFGGYGNNSITPAMPLVMENRKFLIGLMALGENIAFEYDQFFAMIPTGTDPNSALTEGFFASAAQQTPKPRTVAIVAADAPFSKNPIEGARANAAKNGLDVISETKYPLTTTDFSPFLKEAKDSSADIVFYCAYLNDSIGLIRAVEASNM